MADQISPMPLRALDANGKPVAGALLSFTLSGTNTPVTVYKDTAATVPHASPIVADSKGVWAEVYEPTGALLKATATTPLGAALPGFPIDPCVRNAQVGSGAAQVSFASSTAMPYANVQAALEGVNAAAIDAKRGRTTNRIINGDFAVWQRGTTGSANGYTAADRWLNSFVGGAVTQSQQSHTVGDAFGSNIPTFFLRQTVSGHTLSTQYALTGQRIEGVRSYAGQTITVMGWAKRFSGTGNMAVETVQTFGTGGSPSAQITGIGSIVVTLGTTWAPFAVAMTIPSVAGKTLGSNGDDCLEVNFWTSAGTTFNTRAASLGLQTLAVDLWGVHVRVGTFTTADVTDYVATPTGDILRQCQRYYETGSGEVYGSAGAGSISIAYRHTFKEPKRAVPTLSYAVVTSTNVSTFDARNANTDSFLWYSISTAAGGTIWSGTWTASAEL